MAARKKTGRQPQPDKRRRSLRRKKSNGPGLEQQLKEAHQREAATAAILKVISRSPTDLQPVFDAILQSATSLCDADTGILFRYESGAYQAIATRIPDAEFAEFFTKPRRPGPKAGLGRLISEKRPVHIPDVLDDDAYREGDPGRLETIKLGGVRTWLGVPMLKDGELSGAIVIYRKEQRAFGDQQISLLQTFADQAVIAIENVRLFNETKEALERQTATAEILKVISSSLTNIQPVFDSILENATRLCEAHLGFLSLYDGEKFQTLAYRGANPEFAAWIVGRGRFIPPPGSALDRMVAERQPIHIADYKETPLFRNGLPMSVKLVELGGVRTYLAVPMFKEGRVIGGITVYRPDVRPFTQKQIELVSTFADQAVIAIENVRLFNETKEALERQTATAEILKVIGSSTTDTQPVFDAIVETGLRLFNGHGLGILLAEGDRIQLASAGGIVDLDAARKRYPMPLNRSSVSGQAILDKSAVNIADCQAPQMPETARSLGQALDYRAIASAPMLREGVAIGAITVLRRAAGALNEKEMALLTTFADQAVIAIQNARLFREIAEKSYQLELASQHKSQFLSSMSHELRTPLNAILGFNEMLLGEVYGPLPGDMKEPMEDIQKSGRHLLRLINNVLDLAKIEAGRMELALSDYSVQDTVESVRSTLRPLAAEKGLEFLASVPADIPLAYGDGGRITQCLMNLAGNSLKFTKAGKVEIAVELKDGTLVYRVADTGVGIPPDKIDSLFTEFKQTDATIASEYGGTGLGLSITRKFIEMHGGRIWAESEVGKGSRFIFQIPLRAGERAAA